MLEEHRGTRTHEANVTVSRNGDQKSVLSATWASLLLFFSGLAGCRNSAGDRSS